MNELKEILTSLGYKLKSSGDGWRTNAVYRGGKNRTSLSIAKDGSGFFDFSINKGGSIKELIRLTLNVSQEEVDLFLKDSRYQDIIQKDFEEKIETEKIWNEKYLQNLLPHFKFYQDKGISEKTLRFFKSGLCQKGDMYQRYVFPIYNKNGKIHGVSGRNISKKNQENDDYPKWIHLGRKTSWIYPFFMQDENGKYPCQQDIFDRKEIIIVESIGDILSLYEAGFKNSFFMAGSHLSNKQIAFLSSLDINRVIIATNNDINSGNENKGKQSAIETFIKLAYYINIDRMTITLPQKKDFGEMNKEEIEAWYHKVSKINKKYIYKEVALKLNEFEKDDFSLIKNKTFQTLKNDIEQRNN